MEKMLQICPGQPAVASTWVGSGRAGADVGRPLRRTGYEAESSGIASLPPLFTPEMRPFDRQLISDRRPMRPPPARRSSRRCTMLYDVEEKLARAKEAAADQRSGLLGVGANAARKLELRRTMREAHLAHIAQVARAAGREAPEVAQKFVFRPGTTTYVAFQTTARAFLAEAEKHRELLVRHGLVESVLAELRQSLDQFDAAMVSGAEARAAHVRASAELRRLADEVVQGVKVLDRFNRVRFRGTPEVLAAWRSVSSVIATPRGKTEPEAGPGSGGASQEGGEVRPAA
jgi:hypothetical protein